MEAVRAGRSMRPRNFLVQTAVCANVKTQRPRGFPLTTPELVLLQAAAGEENYFRPKGNILEKLSGKSGEIAMATCPRPRPGRLPRHTNKASGMWCRAQGEVTRKAAKFP